MLLHYFPSDHHLRLEVGVGIGKERMAGRISRRNPLRGRTLAGIVMSTGGCISISDDGDTIAFTEDPTRGLDFDITIVDRRAGTIVPTNLLAKLRAA